MKMRVNGGRVTFPVKFPNGYTIIGYQIWFDFKTNLRIGMNVMGEERTEHVMLQEVILPDPVNTSLQGSICLEMDTNFLSVDYAGSPFIIVWIIET